jgi:hypothetical protein
MTTPSLRLRYLPVNAIWTYVFGDTLLRLHVADKTFYLRRAEAVADARLCGLDVAPDGAVTVRPEAAS